MLEKSGLHWAVLEEFLQGAANAYVRLLPDIMLNLQVSDQLSGSMQEHLYAGNSVLAGAWLPYDIFIEEGAVIQRLDSFEALPTVLEDMIVNHNTVKKDGNINRTVIGNLSDWKQTIGSWISLYEKLMEEHR